MNEKNHALGQANAQMASVREMVARLAIDRERLDCEDWEDAEQRIIEDALSVEVRSGWTLPQAMHNAENWAEEFRIVLCTGGPHVQIRGELENGWPSRAWLEYQDWGIPMTARVNDEGDEEALLAYARCFYFGE